MFEILFLNLKKTKLKNIGKCFKFREKKNLEYRALKIIDDDDDDDCISNYSRFSNKNMYFLLEFFFPLNRLSLLYYSMQ